MTTTAPQQSSRNPLAVSWRRVALAVTFLTRLPLPIRGEVTADDLRASMGWYPLVGALLGGLGWGAYALGARVFSPTVAAVLAIILLEVCTGALHLDGFMDTCDGMGSGKPRERALEIMKDSRVGAMGVFGAIAVLLVKVSALAALAPAAALAPLVIGWTAARLLPLLDVMTFPYARASGTGGLFTDGRSRWALPLAVMTVLIVAIAAHHCLSGGLMACTVIGVTLLVQTVIARKLGGLTGDVYGLGIELAETLALLSAFVLSQCFFTLPW